MKTLSHTFLLSAAVLCGFRVDAAVNPAIVPADARWVLHADLNALRESTLGKELVAVVGQSRIDLGGSKVGLDVPKVLATIGTITAYGANFHNDPRLLDGTMVLQGTEDLRKILESLLLQGNLASPETVEEITDLPFPAYRLVARHPAPAAAATPAGAEPVGLFVAFPPEPVVLASKSRQHLLKAHDAFRGTTASVAKSPDSALAPLLRNSRDSYLFAASIVPPGTVLGNDATQARILQMTNSGTIAIGEEANQAFAHARLFATSETMADKLMKIVQGVAAMISLAETNDRQLAEFMNSAKVDRSGNVVTLDIAYPAERLVQMVKSLQQTTAQHRAETQAAARSAQLINGEAVAQWNATVVPPGSATHTPEPLASQTIDNVTLRNGTIISLGRVSNGGKNTRFDSIEITPAAGGAPLVFKTEYLRRGGPRGALWLLQFPGVDGVYRIKVDYTNDPTGKTSYAVSLRQPKTEAAEGDAATAPTKS